MVFVCLVNTIKDYGTKMSERQIPALFRPRVRDSEITITNPKTRYAYIAIVDWDKIGLENVNLRPNGVLRDSIKVKVSKA